MAHERWYAEMSILDCTDRRNRTIEMKMTEKKEEKKSSFVYNFTAQIATSWQLDCQRIKYVC